MSHLHKMVAVKLIKIRIFCVFVILSLNIFNFQAQQVSSPQVKMEYIVRFKPLGMVIIEDLWVRSFSAGVELRYNKQFSFVADIVHFRWKYEREVYKTPGNVEDYDEYAQFDARNYLAFELRYYPQFKKNISEVRPYINLFSKIGGRFLHTQDQYPLDDQEVFGLNSSFYDLGTSLGCSIGNRFGFDFNVGAVYHWENKNEDVYQKNGPMLFRSSIANNRWIGNIRVSFYYNFNGKKSKL